MHAVCVFCGSSAGTNPAHREAARSFGTLLARENLTLVYGGGHVGLMGIVADAVLVAGGRVVGVIPRFMIEKELAHTGLTELLVVESMHARKALMAERSDAFVALPGGFGTGDELFEILTWRQLRLHGCPVGILNVDGFFDPLLTWLDRMVADGLLRPSNRSFLEVATTPEEMLRRLRHPTQPTHEEKWYER
jgi:uncharacterized protein (TIGR00730 family)